MHSRYLFTKAQNLTTQKAPLYKISQIKKRLTINANLNTAIVFCICYGLCEVHVVNKQKQLTEIWSRLQTLFLFLFCLVLFSFLLLLSLHFIYKSFYLQIIQILLVSNKNFLYKNKRVIFFWDRFSISKWTHSGMSSQLILVPFSKVKKYF